MKRSRFTEVQIIGILKEHAAGVSVEDLCLRHGVSDATVYKWKAKYGGMDVSEAITRQWPKRSMACSRPKSPIVGAYHPSVTSHPQRPSQLLLKPESSRLDRDINLHQPLGIPGRSNAMSRFRL